MPIAKKVINFLDRAGVKYEPVKHRTVYTAHDKAATLRANPKIIGKTLVLSLDKQLAVVLIPANRNLDKNKIKKAARAKKVDFVSERVIKNKIKGVKLGAIPPLGNLWKINTFVDSSLLRAPKIFVNAGDHEWSLKMSPATFKKLIPGLVSGNFSKPRKK